MKSVKFAAAVVVLCLLASRAVADDPLKPGLQGLSAVKLSISMSQALVDAGVNGKRLRTQTELQLRKAGLKVDPSAEGSDLSVEITGVRGPGTDTFACIVSITLLENAKVERNGQDIVAVIWGPDQYVLYLPSNLQFELFNTTQDRIDAFLNDWLRVNSK